MNDITPCATQKMKKYNDALGDNQAWVTISEIIVPTEYDKQQLLLAFEYIHNLCDINPDYMAVNTIMHLYQRPELIKVVLQDVVKIDETK